MIRIGHVAPNSLAARAGISAGDLLLEANGRQIRDVLDLRFYTAEVFAQLTVQTGDGRVLRREFDLSTGAPLGIEVEEFRPKACNNKCIFCFIDQLPRG
ncbi:MAG: PDZ domain-containing protein, partial [Acidobacteria bacterium]|nr:PDZ domain-containing protein [Acidobacteriota bacterium]